MFIFPLSTTDCNLKSENETSDNELIFLTETNEPNEPLPQIYAILVSNQNVSFFRSEPNKPLQHIVSDSLDERWNSISGFLVLRKVSKGLIALGWKDELLYFITISPQNNFESSFDRFSWNSKSEPLQIKCCKESETNGNEVLLIATDGYFVVIQTGFKTHKVKYNFRIMRGMDTVNAHLVDDYVIACTDNSVIFTYSCHKKEVVSKITLPKDEFLSFNISLEHKFMTAVAGAYLVKTDFEVDYSRKTSRSESTFNFIDTGIRWGTILLPFPVTQGTFCIYDTKIFAWTSNEFAAIDLKSGETLRRMQLLSSQTVFCCPSIKAVVLVEKSKFNILMHVDESFILGATTSAKIDNNPVLDLRVSKRDLNYLQKNLLTFFLSYWEFMFVNRIPISENDSDEYLESLSEICECFCMLDLSLSHQCLKASLSRLHLHILQVFKSLCQDSEPKNASVKNVLNGLTNCLTSIRIKFGLKPPIESRSRHQTQSTPVARQAIEIKPAQPAQNVRLGATVVQKSACKLVAEMLLNKTPDVKVNRTLQKADLPVKSTLAKILSRSFDPDFTNKFFQLQDAKSLENLNLDSEVVDFIQELLSKDFSLLKDPEDNSVSFSMSALSKFSSEAKRDLICSIGGEEFVTELEHLKFLLKFYQVESAKDFISQADVEPDDIYEVVSKCSYDIRNELLEHMYIFTEYLFPSVQQNLEFYIYTEDDIRFTNQDQTEVLASFCDLSNIDGRLSVLTLNALLPLVDVENCQLEKFDWDVRNVVMFYKLGQNTRHEDFAQTVVDSKSLWMEKSAFEVPGLSDLAMLPYWELLTDEQKKLFSARSLEAAERYETVKLVLSEDYPELITCSMYDLLDETIGVKVEKLFLWQNSNERRRSFGLDAELPIAYPNFDDVMEVAETSVCFPSFQYYLMHGRPTAAFQIILLKWSSLKEASRVKFRNDSVRTIQTIGYENASNDVVVSSAIVLLMMMGEPTIYVRVKIQLLKFLKSRDSVKQFLENNCDSEYADLPTFLRVAEMVISNYSISSSSMKRSGNWNDYFCQFLSEKSFLVAFAPYLKYFPLSKLLKHNSTNPFYFWTDFLGFAHRFGLSIEDLMELIRDMDDSPLKEHFLLCFDNFSSYASILRSQRKTSAHGNLTRQRSNLIKKLVSLDKSAGIEEESGSRQMNPRRSIDLSREDPDMSSSSSTEAGSPAAKFQSLSSMLRLIRKDSDLKTLKIIAKSDKPFLTALCFGASEHINPEQFMHSFLNASGYHLSSTGHQEASVLTNVPFEVLSLGEKLSNARLDVEPLESDHFTEGLLESLQLIPDQEKYAEKFEEFMENFMGCGSGTALVDGEDKSFVDRLFESCVKSFDNFECQRHCVLMFTGLQEHLSIHSMAQLYMHIHELQLPFYWPLDMRVNFPNVEKMESLVKKLISELISRDLPSAAIQMIKDASGFPLREVLIDLRFVPIRSEIVRNKRFTKVRQYFVEAMLSMNLADFGLSQVETMEALGKEGNFKLCELSSIMGIKSIEGSPELKAARGVIYEQLLDKIHLNSEVESMQSIVEDLNLNLSKDAEIDLHLDDEKIKKYLTLRKETLADQSAINFITELIKAGFAYVAVDLCIKYSKPIRVIIFILTAKILLEGKIKNADFCRFVDLQANAYNQKASAIDLIFTTCEKNFAFCREFLDNLLAKVSWHEALNMHGNDPDKALEACIAKRDHEFVKRISQVVSAENAVLIAVTSHYSLSGDFVEYDESFDKLILALPNKTLLMDKMCRLAHGLLKSHSKPFSAISLLGHALHCLEQTYNFHELQKFENILIKMIEILKISYDFEVSLHSLKILGSLEIVGLEIVNLISANGSMIEFVEQHKDLAKKFKKFLVPLMLTRPDYHTCLKTLEFNQEYARVISTRARRRLNNQFSVNLSSPDARHILKDSSRDFYDAYQNFERDKRFRESSACMKMAKLCILQMQLLQDMTTVVNMDRQPDSAFIAVASNLKLVGQILTFLDAYDKIMTVFPQIVCERVLFNGDFEFFEAIYEYMELSPVFMKTAQVIAKQKMKESSNREATNQRLRENLAEARRRNPNRQYLGQAVKAGFFS